MQHLAIAIDGPAASGKSTLAKGLAKELGLVMVNSGAMYRAVAFAALQAGADFEDSESLLNAFQTSEITFGTSGHLSTVELDGKILDDELRSTEVNQHVSAVAKHPEVRTLLVSKQREYLQHSHVVMEGRDIGTVVFADSPYKLYLNASTETRQARRDAEGIQDSIADRDKADSGRKASPLKIADDAIIIDVDQLNIDTVRTTAIQALRDKGLPL